MVMLKELFDDAMKNLEQPKREKRTRSQETGVRNVYLVNCPRCKHGFMFQYRYMDTTGHRRIMTSVDFKTLKNKVIKNDMQWIVDDKSLVNKILRQTKVNE